MSWLNRKVFITGAGGFIGSALTEKMLIEGARVTILLKPNINYKGINFIKNIDKIQKVEGFIEDFESIYKVIKLNQIDTVFHLAANNSNIGAIMSPISIFDSNIRGTWNILEACRLCSEIESVVIASSKEAEMIEHNEEIGSKLPFNRKFQPYQVSKISAELISRSYADTYDLPVTIFRSENIYGGGDLNWSRLIPGAIQCILNKRSPVLRSNGNLVRQYIYIDDIIEAYKELGSKSNLKGIRGEVINFTSENFFSAIEIIKLLYEISEIDFIEPIIINNSVNERIDNESSNQLKFNALTCRNSTSIKNGLKLTLDWYKNYFDKSMIQE